MVLYTIKYIYIYKIAFESNAILVRSNWSSWFLYALAYFVSSLFVNNFWSASANWIKCSLACDIVA